VYCGKFCSLGQEVEGVLSFFVDYMKGNNPLKVISRGNTVSRLRRNQGSQVCLGE
jgi:hypothetical protein